MRATPSRGSADIGLRLQRHPRTNAACMHLERARAAPPTGSGQASATRSVPADHVVTKWLGRSPPVAAKHSLQTRDAHFEVAIRGGARLGSEVRVVEAAHD